MILRVEVQACGDGFFPFGIDIDDSLISPVIGEIYLFSGSSRGRSFEFCGEVRDLQPSMSTTPNTVILDTYESCEECLQENATQLIFEECIGSAIGGNFGSIVIDITQWSQPLPSIGDTFFLSFYVNTGLETPVLAQYEGCFTFSQYSIGGGRGISLTQTFLTNVIPETDCNTCLENSPIIYEVSECISGDIYYISFPNNQFDGHIITFTDLVGLTQYCGIVGKQLESPQPTTGILVTDLGIADQGSCELCLASVSEKRKIEGCLDPSESEIVWASTLFNVGDSTHLSTGVGCYTISDDIIPPESAVTLNELANYAPQENCDDCLECYGLNYDFVTCEEIEICDTQNNIPFNTSSNSREFVIDSSDNMFITLQNSNQIWKFDLATQSFIVASSTINSPFGIDIDEVNGVICVSNQNSASVSFVDYTDLSNVNTVILSGHTGGRDVYYEPIDGLFYVTFDTCCSNQNIRVFSASSYNSVTQVAQFGSTGNGYRDIIRIGSLIYVLNRNNQSIEVYDLTYTLVNTIFLLVNPESFDFDGIDTLYIATTNMQSYLKLTVSTGGLTVVPFLGNCFGFSDLVKIKLNQATNRLYITNGNCGIYEFELSTDTLLRTYGNDISISQPFGIGNDSSGSTWFGDFNQIFQLGCEFGTQSGQTTSNEYLEVGQTFFNPYLNACCEITSSSSILNDQGLNLTEYWSMVNYDDCEACLLESHETFYCELCDFDFGFNGIFIAPAGQYNIGDIVRSEYGSSNFLCFEIIDNYDVSNYGTGYPIFETSTSAYTSCEDCTNSSFVGITLINLNTLQPLTANISTNDWLRISGLLTFSLPFTTISDENGVCYQIVNLCPISDDNPVFTINEVYINQLFCRLGNLDNQPRSANTEVFICIPDCYFTGSTAVTPPHPVWTDGYGTPVTQLNMITIGGNGLNG